MNKLDNMKVGDAVCLVRRNGWKQRVDIYQGAVEKVTATQITAMGGRRFKKDTGREIGNRNSRWSVTPTLEPLTSELLAEAALGEEYAAAERICAAWAKKLERARDENALALAKILPEIPEQA
jgi:hypothetical protein